MKINYISLQNKIYRIYHRRRGLKIMLTGMILFLLFIIINVLTNRAITIFVIIPWLFCVIGLIDHWTELYKESKR